MSSTKDTTMSNGVNADHVDTEAEVDEDAVANTYEPGAEEDVLLGNTPKIIMMSGATTHAVSFQIEKEDHTLGNSLRYFINKNPDVEFCGYTIPHPSETRMCVRIQTWEDTNTTAVEALRKGLEDMIEACEVVEDKFVTARDEFEKNST